MEGNTNSAWLFIAVIAGAVGSAMFIYGIRQKRPVPLVFGVLIGGYEQQEIVKKPGGLLLVRVPQWVTPAHGLGGKAAMPW